MYHTNKLPDIKGKYQENKTNQIMLIHKSSSGISFLLSSAQAQLSWAELALFSFSWPTSRPINWNSSEMAGNQLNLLFNILVFFPAWPEGAQG